MDKFQVNIKESTRDALDMLALGTPNKVDTPLYIDHNGGLVHNKANK
jgi:hypothetical protein